MVFAKLSFLLVPLDLCLLATPNMYTDFPLPRLICFTSYSQCKGRTHPGLKARR